MNQIDYLKENIAILEKQDPAFEYLAESMNDVLLVLIERGKEYNGDASGVYEQMYGLGDMSAFVHTNRPMLRTKQILSNNGIYCPDEKILDKIIDANGYGQMWLCCRKVKRNGDV